MPVNTERVSSSGKIVRLSGGELFNLMDERGVYKGQAVWLPQVEVVDA